MAVAERDLQVLALHRRAIADAVDLEPLLEALGDAGDQVGDSVRDVPHCDARALGLVARIDLDLSAVELDRDVVRAARPESAPFGPFTLTVWPSTLAVMPEGTANAFLPIRDIQNTVQRISPPTLASRASWSAMTPFGVETMATPRPLLMRGRFLTEV